MQALARHDESARFQGGLLTNAIGERSVEPSDPEDRESTRRLGRQSARSGSWPRWRRAGGLRLHGPGSVTGRFGGRQSHVSPPSHRKCRWHLVLSLAWRIVCHRNAVCEMRGTGGNEQSRRLLKNVACGNLICQYRRHRPVFVTRRRTPTC